MLSGFSKASRNNVTLSVGATVGINFALSPGAVTETVQVTGSPPDIQTEKADISSVVDEETLKSLPLISRNVLGLITLQPGITGVPSDTGNDIFVAEQGLGLNASGTRESANNAMVDGVTISNNAWGGTVLLVPNAEAVQEFEVIANNPSAEFGRNSGAAVSLVTKSGTNQFSGSAYEFKQIDDLRARNFFEADKPDFDRDDFGLTVGGPIRRDRTFFFVSFNGVREEGSQGQLWTVETPELRAWTIQNRPDSIAAELLDAYRPPMDPTLNLRDLGSP